jgi:pyruvate dehydrogenase E2 component (dihydrolipoamide acetyltransferase)
MSSMQTFKNEIDVMEKEIKIPQVAEGVESATVTDILVKEGDSIEKGQSVIVVESDKASVEVPSEESGKVKTIRVKKDTEIKPGEVILILETEEKQQQPEVKEANLKEPNLKETNHKEPKPKEPNLKETKPKETNHKEPKTGKEGEIEEKPEKKEEEPPKKKEDTKEAPSEEIAAIPNALRLARELGININDIKGSGPQEKILEEDVIAYAREIIQGKLKSRVGEETLPDFSQWGEIEKIQLKSIRKATAKRTAALWRIIPHVTHFDEVEISKIEELIKHKNPLVEKKGSKLTITAILLKILAEALKEFPTFNASIDAGNEEIILKKYIHIGVAVDTERGLLVPVIRNVDKKNLIAVSVELRELSEKARNGNLSADEMNGGSFVISNVGSIGGTQFTQLIYHPQVAILGVAKAKIQPVFEDGIFKPKLMLPLSISYDHRLIDGADAARFLTWIREVIENPLNMFMDEQTE